MDNAVKSRSRASKVCQLCGVVGYKEFLTTCSGCRRAQQHICLLSSEGCQIDCISYHQPPLDVECMYHSCVAGFIQYGTSCIFPGNVCTKNDARIWFRYCMPVIQLQIPDSWLCEDCLMGVPVVSEGKDHNLNDAHKSVTLSHPSVSGEKQVHRMLGPLCGPDAAPRNFNIVKDGRGRVKGFPSDKDVMRPSLRYPSLRGVEYAKVKFLPPEEFTSARSKACKGQSSLGESSRPNDHAKVTSHIPRRLVGNKLVLPGSKVTTDDTEVDVSLTTVNEPSELVTNDKDTSIKRTKISGFPSSNCVRPNVSNTIDAPSLDTGDESRKNSLGPTCSDVQTKGCSRQEMCFSKFLMNIGESALNSRPVLDAYWKGTFEVCSMYYPPIMATKAYELLKNSPVNLKLKIVPRMDAWPKLFQLRAPLPGDAVLVFLPAGSKRSKEKYTCLLAWIDAHDSAMQTSVGNAELLIYSSTQLPTDYQGIDERTYLWGVFKHTIESKHQTHNLEMPSQVAAGIKDNNYPAQFAGTFGAQDAAGIKDNNYPAQFAGTFGAQDEVDMEIDMIGGIEVGRIDFVLPNPNGPPGFQRQIRRDANHAYMSTFRFP